MYKKLLCINPVITGKSHKEVIKCAIIINYTLKSGVTVVMKSFVAMLHSLHGIMNNGVRNFSAMNSVATEKVGKIHEKLEGSSMVSSQINTLCFQQKELKHKGDQR